MPAATPVLRLLLLVLVPLQFYSRCFPRWCGTFSSFLPMKFLRCCFSLSSSRCPRHAISNKERKPIRATPSQHTPTKPQHYTRQPGRQKRCAVPPRATRAEETNARSFSFPRAWGEPSAALCATRKPCTLELLQQHSHSYTSFLYPLLRALPRHHPARTPT